MKTIRITVLLILWNLAVQSQNEQVFLGCATDELLYNNSTLLQAQNELDSKYYNHFSKNNTSGPQRAIATIPVVVHIIHNGGTENISNAQVQTAITNINTKFAQSNNYQIQFCLAQRDPQGDATIGITRNSSSLTTETMETDDIALKNINRWSPTCYLNIWVVKEILSLSSGSSVIGYAYFPSAHGSATDGIVIEANYFGASATNDAVGTHEIGHYLGLYHTFQNGCINNDCLQDGDKVCDTPPDQTTFATCNPSANSCSTDTDDPSANNPFSADAVDYSDDYMDYSKMSCYTQFTAGQYSRMEYYLTTTRKSLLTCLSCTSPCPAPLTATITIPGDTININTGTVVSFTGTATNSTNHQWYINLSTIIGTGLTSNHTFNTAGNYWMKFHVISSDPSLCTDAVDSVLVIVTEPAVASCKGSLQFNNYNDAVQLPNNNQYYSSNGFTWECWFKLNTALDVNQQVRPLICAIDNVTYEDLFMGFGWFAVGYAPGDKLIFRVDAPNSSGGPNANGCSYAPPGGFLVGTWYHAAGVMNYATQTGNLYLNGQLVDTKNITSDPFTRIISTALSWDAIANPGYTFPALGGNMDEVRIWNRARTAAEIAASYDKCMAGNETNLLLYYRCNQSAGSNAIDATANTNNGTLLNTAAWSNQEPSYTGTICVAACIEICGNGIDDNLNGDVDENCVPCIPPTLDIGNDTAICSTGITIFDADAGFKEYIWNDGSRGQTYTAYGPGKYWVTVKDSCEGVQSDTITITTLPSPTLNLGNDTTICSDDSLLFNFTSNGVYKNYNWTPSTGLSCVNCPNPYAKPSTLTKYYLVASTAEGCTNVDSITINILNGSNSSFNSDTMCRGQNATLTALSGSIYLWSTSETTNPIIVSPINTTTYSVVIGSGCADTVTFVVMVNSSPIAITSGDTTIKYGQSATLTSVGGTTYQWFPPNGLNCINCATPTATPTATTKYCVITRTIDACADTACLIVTVELNCDLESEIFVPNVFSPNGDEQNDVLHVYGSGITELFWSIYNRWGEKVFETTDPTQGWDGKFKGKELDPAVFVYYLNVTCITGEVIKRQGNITIIK
ncbi:MAG: LamG-like jellyroll fold domain-containing protein [Bacteroidota bacterium]